MSGVFAAMRGWLRTAQGKCLLATLGAWTCWACAAARADDLRKASTSRQARDEALAAMPSAQLDPQTRFAVEDVVKNPSIYRRMPTQVIDCDPHFYLFLMENPEVIVQIWRVLGISNVSLERTGENAFRAADNEGTTCEVRRLFATHDRQLLYATGAYEGSVLKNRVEARCVLMLRSAYIRETNGRHYVTCVLDAFVRIDRGGVELLAKTFQSLIGKSADMNFAETMGFISSLSRTAEVNPDGLARISQRLAPVREETRDRLAVISAEVASRSARSEEARRVQYQEEARLEPGNSTPRR